jgi:hypothetical protein
METVISSLLTETVKIDILPGFAGRKAKKY